MRKRTAVWMFAAVAVMSVLAGCSTEEKGNFTGTMSEVESQSTESTIQTSEVEESYDGRLVSDGIMELDYAKEFSVERFLGGYRMITVGETEKYLVVPEDRSVPKELEEGVVVLEMPIDKVYVASTSLVSLIDAIGELSRVKLVATDVEDWYIASVTEAMKAGRMGYSGSFQEPDYEKMVEQGIELHIDTTMIDTCPEVKEKFAELSIPSLVEISSKESHPLARVEWVKLMGVLFGKETEAEEYFDNQKALMERAMAAEKSGVTVAMGYITSSGKYYARNGGDYLVQMIEMAGGEYVCADIAPEKSGNTSMSFEEWYAAFQDADYLFYWNFGNKFYSIQEMIAYEPLLADLKAVKEGHVWITSPDFSQATSAISSIVSDMNTILFSENPDEVTTDHLLKLPLTTE